MVVSNSSNEIFPQSVQIDIRCETDAAALAAQCRNWSADPMHGHRNCVALERHSSHTRTGAGVCVVFWDGKGDTKSPRKVHFGLISAALCTSFNDAQETMKCPESGLGDIY